MKETIRDGASIRRREKPWVHGGRDGIRMDAKTALTTGVVLMKCPHCGQWFKAVERGYSWGTRWSWIEVRPWHLISLARIFKHTDPGGWAR